MKSKTIAPKFAVLAKLAAAIAVFLGGSSIALASLAEKQATETPAAWGDSGPSSPVSGGSETDEPDILASSADEGGIDLDGLLAALGVDRSASEGEAGPGQSQTSGTDQTQTTSTSSRGSKRTTAAGSRRSTATSSKGDKKVVSPTSSSQPGSQTSSDSGSSTTASSPVASPSASSTSEPSPTPSESAEPSPTPSESPSNPPDKGPNLSADGVLDVFNGVHDLIIEAISQVKRAILTALGFESEPTPADVLAKVPDVPETPDPEAPDVPDVPETPDPEAPDVPDVPETPDPEAPTGDSLMDDIADLLTTIKNAIRNLLGLDADNPPTAEKIRGDAEAAAGVATGLAGTGADLVTSTATDVSGNALTEADTKADSVTSTATAAAVRAQAEGGAAFTTATATAGEAAGTAVGVAGFAAGEVKAQAEMLPPVLVGVTKINVKDASGSSVAVIEGHEYRLDVSGKYYYGALGGLQADASCATTDGVNWSASPFGEGILDLRVGDDLVGWQPQDGGGCDANHKYTVRFTAPKTGEIKLSIVDPSDYGDNNDDLTDLFKVEMYDLSVPKVAGSSMADNPLSIGLGLMLLIGSASEAANRRKTRISALSRSGE